MVEGDIGSEGKLLIKVSVLVRGRKKEKVPLGNMSPVQCNLGWADPITLGKLINLFVPWLLICRVKITMTH